MTYDAIVEIIRQGGLTAFLIVLWWLERKDRLAAEQRQRERFLLTLPEATGGGAKSDMDTA